MVNLHATAFAPVLTAGHVTSNVPIPSLLFSDFTAGPTILPYIHTPATAAEGVLVEALRASQAREGEWRSRVQAQQAALVLQGIYCEQTRQQLQANNKEKQKKKSRERLVGDGLPILLTSDEFSSCVVAHKISRSQDNELRKRRKAAADLYAEECRSWKAAESARVERNNAIRVANAEAVMSWKARKAEAAVQRVRFSEKKPDKPIIEDKIPKPKKPKMDKVVAMQGVELQGALFGGSGSSGEDETSSESGSDSGGEDGDE
jgi:hypothetical protein